MSEFIENACRVYACGPTAEGTMRFQKLRELTRASREITSKKLQPNLFAGGRDFAHSDLGLRAGWTKGLIPDEISKGAEHCLRQIVWQIARQPFGEFTKLTLRISGRTAPKPTLIPSFRDQVSYFVGGLRRVAYYFSKSNEALPKSSSRYAVLYYARPFNLPPAVHPPHYDWATWSRQSGVIDPITEIWASDADGPIAENPEQNLRRVRQSLPAFRSNQAYRAFRFSLLRLSASVALRWIGGAWWAPLLFRDLVELAHCRSVDRRDLAESYFFPPQFQARRPLWSWWAEHMGARVAVVFYSHNFQAHFDPESPDSVLNDPIYSLIRWPEAIFMTERCGSIMKASGAEIAKTIVSGPVSMVDSGTRIEFPRRLLVGVFDIDPERAINRAVRGLPQPYHTREVVRDFLEHVSAAVVANNAVPVWKPKGALRLKDAVNATDLRHDRIAHLDIAQRYGAIICPGGVPIHFLAENLDTAVALPFTSVPTIFRLMHQTAAYYDPTGQLGNHNGPARDIPILTDRQALTDWIRQAISMPPTKSHLSTSS